MFKFVLYFFALNGLRQFTAWILLNTSWYFAEKNPTGFSKKLNTELGRVLLRDAANFHSGTAEELRKEFEDALIKYDKK